MSQTISTEPLAQILRSITSQRRTGMLRIEQLGRRNAEQGEMYFEQGRLIRARAGQEIGNPAIQRISTWKQITCSFTGTSRPFPVQTRVLAPVQKPGASPFPLARRLSEGRTETEKLPGTLELLPSQEFQKSKNWPALPRTDRQQAFPEAAHALQTSLATSPTPVERSFILHGATLEEYAPPQAPKLARATQRWTTHIEPDEQETIAFPPAATPRLEPLSGKEFLPGRMAIFKVKTTAATTRTIQHMERRERIIFILLDGRRTVQDIARLIHQPEADVEEILVRLAKNGFVQQVEG